ncbi:hypothetical protein CDO52_08225 [Nocardiopsis gilva YIM 90087]|uniref:Uncharacterized protein n=1 Tax=Nocardiopsis gilva YIM 90087 TaxID=1235441 RepID=A0A223S3R7_9ACTN|nr:hypothetical protein [Nocardiopsis gilva]ASU82770.1 hypothetical protein CDO52_08225 [Nocardiopsis gilva YIM 90087]
MLRRFMVAVAPAAALLVLVGLGFLVWAVFIREPFEARDYSAMCDSPRAFEQAAPYTDEGPHPIRVDYGVEADDSEESTWRPTDPETVQLVACTTPKGKGDHVDTCEYAESEFSSRATHIRQLYLGIHTVTIYGARTGKVVGEEEIIGDQFRLKPMTEGAEVCQLFVNLPSDAPRQEDELSRPSHSQMREALESYVE